ncbi:hypothetical protein [Bifidobacterium jacchi]|uniref:Uncharacterized protein n=1 Tax=Bifidobacterium jacchi TaxID=2490545 RepID=A0A5N5RJ90_9BIFI|nr:hypothetical protein [Bifidobacterium jacchi]KAB5607386.1 hypothetical protein EHS19_04870 [Bifidobacterium jacchi]
MVTSGSKPDGPAPKHRQTSAAAAATKATKATAKQKEEDAWKTQLRRILSTPVNVVAKDSTTTKYVDEYQKDDLSRRTHKPIRTGMHIKEGISIYIFAVMLQEVNKHFANGTLPPNMPTPIKKASADGAVPDITFMEYADEFIVDRADSIAKRMATGLVRNDAHFKKYIISSITGWFKGLYDKTESGKVKDALRKRLERDDRFTHSSAILTAKKQPDANWWTLQGGVQERSEVRETELYRVARQYPVEVKINENADSGQQRIRLGKRGQLETMLYHVLDRARGALPLITLHQVLIHEYPNLVPYDPNKNVSLYNDDSENGLSPAANRLATSPTAVEDAAEAALENAQGGSRVPAPLIPAERIAAYTEHIEKLKSESAIRAFVDQHPDVQALINANSRYKNITI